MPLFGMTLGKRLQSPLAVVCAISGLAMLSGCVIVVPTAVPQQRPFVDLAADLQPGVTTAAEIRALVGPPHWRAEREWIYRHPRLGWAWAYCAIGYEYGDCGASDRASTEYFLRVSFSADGVLADYSIETQRHLCEAQRLCIMGNIVSLPAADYLDNESKQFSRSAASCQIYVFPKNDLSAARVYVDNEHFGDLATGDSFFRLSLAPGNHRVIFESAVSTMRGETSIACQAESLYYVRFRYSDSPANPTRVVLLSESRGRLEVGKRWQADPNQSYEAAPVRILRNGDLLAFREGDAVSWYQYDEEARVASFGTNPNGETCGVLSAIVEYKLTPAGGPDALHLVNRKGTRVQLAAVCNAEGRCELPSLFGQPTCRLKPVNAIEFVIPSASDEELLIIEPTERRPYVNDVYFGSAAKIAERATCDGRTCELDLDVVRPGSHRKAGN